MTTTETKWERIARQRAEYAAYLASTTDEPKLSAAEFASAQVSQRVAGAPPEPVAHVSTSPTSAPAAARRRDRVWSGGDRDSDDIYWK